MIEVKVRMFGAFRKYENSSAPLLLRIEGPATVGGLKASLGRRLRELFPDFDQNGEQLIADSAIADEVRVLSPETVLTHSCTLSILPPVCGG